MDSEKAQFIPAGTEARNAGEKSIEALITAPVEELISRWETSVGKTITSKLLEKKINRETLASTVGKMDGRYDLRGIPLENADLNGADLTDIDFFSANLSGANMAGGNLSNTHFSECDLTGADLSWTRMERSFFDSVKFDAKTKLLGVNVNEMNSNLAILLIDQANTQQRIAHIEKRHPLIAFFLMASCDYGRSITRLLFWGAALIVLFAATYCIIPSTLGVSSFLEALYFSIVTTTTLGYGEIVPATDFGRSLVMLQVVLGYIFGGLLVAIIARRVITLNI